MSDPDADTLVEGPPDLLELDERTSLLLRDGAPHQATVRLGDGEHMTQQLDDKTRALVRERGWDVELEGWRRTWSSSSPPGDARQTTALVKSFEAT